MGKTTYEIALAGNPNCGKTSLFNNISGANQSVGNWPGVTVELKTGSFRYNNADFNLIDLPGTYSLSYYSLEEEIVETYFANSMPDVVVNIVDATNLDRHLFLTTQLIDLGLPVIVAVNMMDEAEKLGLKIDFKTLSESLGVPVVPTIARTNKGSRQLLNTILAYLNNPQKAKINIGYSDLLVTEIEKIAAVLKPAKTDISLFGRATNLLCGRKTIVADQKDHKLAQIVKKIKSILEVAYNKETEDVFVGYWLRFAKRVANLAVTKKRSKRFSVTEKIDNYLLHPILGLLIFAAFMWFTFQLVFVAGAPLMTLIEKGIGALAIMVSGHLPAGFLNSLIVDGIIGGVGGVLVFLPNILLLFIVIGFLEDSGYMARAAFVMDRIMHKIGLHGKSFIPMLVGFGCTVPAIMATRSLDTKRDRLITALTLPFMSCGARLPVYALFISAFFAPKYHTLVLFSIYFTGILFVIIMANLLGFMFFGKDTSPFLMELPPYRLPTFKSIMVLMWMRAWMYIKKAGTLLLGASIVMWFLTSYPTMSSEQLTSFFQVEDISQISKDEIQTVNFQNSYASKMGKFIEPALKPLGFDWKIGVGLISGLAAKEAVVSTMGVIYGVDNENNEKGLIEKLQNDPTFKDKPFVAYGFMVFVLLYLPCLAVVAVFRREFGWKWTAFLITYTTIVAWVATYIVRLVSFLW